MLQHLASLLDFIYLVINKVNQDHVKEFLALGEELGVKGLTMSKENLEDQNMLEDKTDQMKSFQDYSVQAEKERLGQRLGQFIKNEGTEIVKATEDTKYFMTTT